MSIARSLVAPGVTLPFELVVVGSHLRWDGVYQRPQHLLSRIADHAPVIVVEEPQAAAENLSEWIENGNITVLRPHRKSPSAASVDDETLAALRTRVGARRPLIWLYTPMMMALSEAFGDAPLVFDAMDELSQFAHADPRLVHQERRVMDQAAIVFCGGPSLYRSRIGRAREVKLYSSGVDVAFFERARALAPHPALLRRTKPVFGYVGVIDERVDLELVAKIADARPDATVAMIGPTAKISAATLPQRSNIIYLGQQAYMDLPALLAGIDVAMMPFALNDSTRNISPTKTLEYLAAGKPVVSTAVPDVVSEYAGIVTIAGDHAAFVEALGGAPKLAAARQVLADERTRAATWDAIAAAMLRDLAKCGIAPQGATSIS